MKKYLSQKKILLAIFLIMIVGIFYRFYTLLMFPDSQIELEKGELVKLQPQDSLTQKFQANRDNLMTVQFLLRTPGIAFEKGDKVSMKLADENCEKTIRQGELASSYLASENLYEFKFPTIANSKDKTFCVIATFKPTKDTAKAIQFFNKNDASGLSIRPAYVNNGVWQNLSELNQRMSQYKPWFLKHYFIGSIMLLFIILSISLVAILITI